jgi:geranylgeranyl diphosphate synthase type I
MDFRTYLLANVTLFDDDLASPYEGTPTHPDLERYLDGPLSAFMRNPGKRFRPLICRIACELVGGDPEDVRTAAAAFERFQTTALIHDDIADESELRRGKPCMYRTEGIGLALNAGDYVMVDVTGAVATDERLSDAVKIRVINELNAMMSRTVEGQALDIGWARDGRYDLTIDDYLFMATHKWGSPGGRRHHRRWYGEAGRGPAHLRAGDGSRLPDPG